MRAADIKDVRAAWRAHRRAHDESVKWFERVVAARTMEDENHALRGLLGSLIELRQVATTTAADLTGVKLPDAPVEVPLDFLYPAIINVDHEEVPPHAGEGTQPNP